MLQLRFQRISKFKLTIDYRNRLTDEKLCYVANSSEWAREWDRFTFLKEVEDLYNMHEETYTRSIGEKGATLDIFFSTFFKSLVAQSIRCGSPMLVASSLILTCSVVFFMKWAIQSLNNLWHHESDKTNQIYRYVYNKINNISTLFKIIFKFNPTIYLFSSFQKHAWLHISLRESWKQEVIKDRMYRPKVI